MVWLISMAWAAAKGSRGSITEILRLDITDIAEDSLVSKPKCDVYDVLFILSVGIYRFFERFI
jgi:hypothetical protein